MKKHLFYILAIAALVTPFAGCHTQDDASNTVPWDSPASFEGAGVGLPKMTRQ